MSMITPWNVQHEVQLLINNICINNKISKFKKSLDNFFRAKKWVAPSRTVRHIKKKGIKVYVIDMQIMWVSNYTKL